MQQYRRGQAPRPFPQQRQHRARPRRPNHYASLLAGRVPGLLTAPTGSLWVAERLAWLPVFAIMLSGLWLAFHRVERG